MEVEAADETTFEVDSSEEECRGGGGVGASTCKTLRRASCLSRIIVS